MAVGYSLKAAGVNIQKEGVNGVEILQYIQSNPKVKLDFVLLDLDMPIMNGFEACKQIIDFYVNSILFRPVKSKQFMRGNKKRNLSSESVNNIIEDMNTQPLMVAYSGLVNDDVRKQAEEAGFNMVFESPLTADMIKNNILSLLKEKSQEVESINHELKRSNEIRKGLSLKSN